MDNEKSLTEGEALLLLVRRSGKQGVEIAKMLNIHPNHLSKLFKSERLTSKIKNRAAHIFNVPLSTFDAIDSDSISLPDAINEPESIYEKRPKIENLTAGDVLKYLEEKDRWFEDERRRYYEERGRLLAIIENLTKPK